MTSERQLYEVSRNISRRSRKSREERGTIMRIEENTVDVRMGLSPTYLKNVPVIGGTKSLTPGEEVSVKWVETDGNPSLGPVVVASSSTQAQAYGGSTSVSVDNVTIENSNKGLRVKEDSIGLVHLSFSPAMSDHIHVSDFEKGGWEFTTDGILFTEALYFHPDGLIKVGNGDDTVVLDSLDTTYRLWAGDADTPASAPFSVTKAGAIKSTSGTIGGWTIGSTTISSGNLIMDSTGLIKSNNYAAGVSGWMIDGDGKAEFEDVIVRGQLATSVLTYNEIHVTGGTQMIGYKAGVLYSDYTTPTTESTIYIANDAGGSTCSFANTDRIRMKDGSNDWWALLSDKSQQSEYASFTATTQNGTTSWAVKAGRAIVGYNPSSGGTIYLSSDGAVGATANISIMQHSTSPWSDESLKVRIGNMYNVYGTGTNNRYGVGIGDYSGGNYMSYNAETSGQFVIKAGDGVVTLDEDGIGISITTTYLDPYAYKIMHGTHAAIKLEGYQQSGPSYNYTARLITDAAGQSKNANTLLYSKADTGYEGNVGLRADINGGSAVTLDLSTSGSLVSIVAASVTMSSDLEIGASGGGLYVGTDVTPPTSNNDIRAAGDLIIGGGIYAGNADYSDVTDGDIVYEGGLYARPVSTLYDVYGFHPISPTQLTDTSNNLWDFTYAASVGTYAFDHDLYNSWPTSAKALVVMFGANFGSSPSASDTVSMRRRSGSTNEAQIRGIPNAGAYLTMMQAIIPCDGSGDVELVVVNSSITQGGVRMIGYFL